MSFLSKLLLAGFFIAFCLSYTGPIMEGDFFYHLRMGQVIWQSGDIPLGFPTQWLGQVIIYLVWRVSGFSGIVLMRAGIYTATLLLLFVWIRRAGVPLYQAIFFLLLPAHMFLSFPSERPQIFGFLLFPLSLYLLEQKRQNPGSRLYWFLPFLLLIWANTHPAFILGLAAVWIYFIPAMVRYLRKKAAIGTVLPYGVIALLSALMLTAMPSTLKALHGLIQVFINPNPYMKSIHEYLSPISAAVSLGEYYPSYWVMLLISAFTILWGIKTMPLEHTILLVFFGLLPFKGLRFMPFFTILSPLTALNNKVKGNWEGGRTLLAGFSVVLIFWLAPVPIKPELGISKEFPDNAVRFLKQAGPEGKIFNYHGWAGYLSWALPERSIFIPASDIPTDVDETYGKVIWADSTMTFNKPEWQTLLDAYRLDIIIMPAISPVSGQIYPLVDHLQNDRDWFLIYSDEVSNILIRDTTANQKIITLYSLPKANIYLQAIAQTKRYLKEQPSNTALRRTLNEAHGRLGIQPK